MRLVYPAEFTPDEDGGFVVTFRDVPEAITQGETIDQCLWEAADSLDEAIAGRIKRRVEIPRPSRARRSEHAIALPAGMALKTALFLAVERQGISNVELARRLGVDEKQARRLLDPRHGTRVQALEDALRLVGQQVALQVA